jgi:ABC-type molybdate transport system substrate-binding protein
MRGLVAVLMAGVLAAGGCAGVNDGLENGTGPAAPPGAGQPDRTGAQAGPIEIRVAVDDPLAEAFVQVEQGFEAHHPNIEVVLSYGQGGSSADRVAGGEPADVVVTDDPFAARGVGRNAEPVEVGRVSLVLVTPGAGASFVDFVRAGDGRRILIDSGLLRS